MKKSIIVGPDRGLEPDLRRNDIETTRIDTYATGDSLADAGVISADILIVTNVSEATAIPIAKHENPDLKVVLYSPDSMPDFVRGQVDLAIQPGVVSTTVIAEELAA